MQVPKFPSALNYASPEKPRPIISVPLLMSGLILTGAILLPALLVTSKFEQIFHDFKMDLPLVTKLFIGISNWIVRDFGWILLVLYLFMPPFLFGRHSGLQSYRVERAIFRFSLIAAMLAIAGTVVALFMPMIALIQSISGSGHK